MPVTTLYFENFISVSELYIKSWFDVPTNQMFIFVLFVSTGVLFGGTFSLWVSLNISVGVLFSLLLCIPWENDEPSWVNYLVWKAYWGEEHNKSDTQNTLINFLSAIAVTQMIFWTDDSFCFISDCRNSFNCKLKKGYKRGNNYFLEPIKCTFFIWRICTDKTF